MCLAILQTNKKPLPHDFLHRAWTDNPHGAGIAISLSDCILVYKGLMRFRQFYHIYRVLCTRHKNAILSIHFRFATHGSVCPELTHPFMVNDDCVFFHNGILPLAPIVDTDSDSSLCADILRRLSPSFPDGELLKHLDTYAIRHFSKFILLGKHGRYHICNEKSGHWDDGNWLSNHGRFIDYNLFNFDMLEYSEDILV